MSSNRIRASRAAALLLLLLVPFAAAQETLSSGVPHDVAVEPGADDVSLPFAYLAEAPGMLFLSAESEGADPELYVATLVPSSGELLDFADQDGGGGTTAAVRLDVEPGQLVDLVLGVSPGQESAGVRLVARQAIERGHAAAFVQRLEELLAAPADSAATASWIDDLLAGESAGDDPAVIALLERLLDAPPAMLDVSGELRARRAVHDYLARYLPATHHELLDARLLLALAFKNVGRPEDALPLEEDVLRRRRDLLAPESRDLLLVRQNLAATRYVLGDLEQAERDFEELELVAAQALPAGDELLNSVRMNRASLLLQRGYPSEAAELYAVVAGHLSVGADSFALANALQNQAAALLVLEQPERAIVVLDRAREVLEEVVAEDDPRLWTIQLRYADARIRLGDIASARLFQERVLHAQQAVLDDDDLGLQVTRHNLAITHTRQGGYAAARRLLEEVVAVREARLSPGHPDLLAARLSLATVCMQLEEIDTARRSFQRIVDDAPPEQSRDLGVVMRARRGLAWVDAELGHAESARDRYESVVEGLERSVPARHPDLLQARTDLAWTLMRTGQLERAEELLLGILRTVRENLFTMAVRRGPREREALTANVRQRLDSALSMVADEEGREPGAELRAELFTLIESVRGLGVTPLGAREDAGEDPRARELAAAVRRADDRVLELARRGGELFEAVRERDAAERALRDRLLDLFGGEDLAQPVSVQDVATRLAENEVAVGFWRYGRTVFDQSGRGRAPRPHYLAHVVRSDGGLTRVELGPADRIDQAVERWRTALLRQTLRGVELARSEGEESGQDEERAAGEVLRRLVLDPLREALGSASTCHVALDDALHMVPMGALPEGEGLVGDRLLLVQRSTFRPFRRPAGSQPQLLALGGIEYDLPPSEDDETVATPRLAGTPSEAADVFRAGTWNTSFPFLIATELEVLSLERLFTRTNEGAPVTILLGSDATRARFEALAPASTFLHVATHAYFAPASIPSMRDDPGEAGRGLPAVFDAREQARGFAPMLLCGLAFAGANLTEDGSHPHLMTAAELARLDLSRVELAVLSACDTNVGVRRAGQGVASLQGALHAAGARAMLTSLWKVPDAASAEIMQRFYRALWIEKRTKADALRAAQDGLRQQVDAAGRPLYAKRDWAAWVLSGDPN